MVIGEALRKINDGLGDLLAIAAEFVPLILLFAIGVLISGIITGNVVVLIISTWLDFFCLGAIGAEGLHNRRSPEAGNG